MTKTERALSELNGTLTEAYGADVNRRIRARYSLSEELSLLRQREEKPDEFMAYNAFVEECKRASRAEILGEEVKT